MSALPGSPASGSSAPAVSTAAAPVRASETALGTDPSCPEGNRPDELVPEAFFGDPGLMWTDITCRILWNIGGTKAGETIRGVTFSFDSMLLAQALEKADERGVKVKVLVGAQANDQIETYLRRELNGSGAKTGGSSFDVSHGPARRELSQVAAGAGGAMHQKSWTFTRTRNKDWVSMVTSANLTGYASEHQFNDGYQFVGYREVHDKLKDVFTDQIKHQAWESPYIEHDFSSITSIAFSPWNSASMPDPVVRRINSLPLTGLTVRITIAVMRGPRGIAIANALASRESKAGGHNIRVLSSDMDPNVREILAASDIPVRIIDRPHPTGEFDEYIHSKSMIARWTGPDGDPEYRLWTGSENWTEGASPQDELTVMVGNPNAWQDYLGYWNYMWQSEA